MKNQLIREKMKNQLIWEKMKSRIMKSDVWLPRIMKSFTYESHELRKVGRKIIPNFRKGRWEKCVKYTSKAWIDTQKIWCVRTYVCTYMNIEIYENIPVQ